jgi:hypothetical protein
VFQVTGVLGGIATIQSLAAAMMLGLGLDIKLACHVPF